MAVGQITWEQFITSKHDARGVRYKFEDLSRQLLDLKKQLLNEYASSESEKVKTIGTYHA